MSDRTGQVWWARYHSIIADFEPYVVVGDCALYYEHDAWSLRLVAEISDPEHGIAICKTTFDHVEASGEDAFLKERIA